MRPISFETSLLKGGIKSITENLSNVIEFSSPRSKMKPEEEIGVCTREISGD